MSLIGVISNMGASVRLISLFASVAVHAAVLMGIPTPLGETERGPAESNSSLHLSVQRSEPADATPRDNSTQQSMQQPSIQERPESSETVFEDKTSPQPVDALTTENDAAKPTPDIIQAKVSKPVLEIRQELIVSEAKKTKTEPRAKPKPKAAPIPTLTSSGSPSSDRKGANAKVKQPMQIATAGSYSRLSRDYRSTLLRLIERHKYYPLRARRNGMEGKTTVSFTVSGNGVISGIGISQSSGKTLLDQAAIQTIKRVGQAPPLPEDIGRSKWKFVVPITYNIR